MQPTWHPDGKRIAWISWNFPNMPWDGTYLRLGNLAKGQENGVRTPLQGLPQLVDTLTIAGDDHTFIFQQLSPPVGASWPMFPTRPDGGKFICTIWGPGSTAS